MTDGKCPRGAGQPRILRFRDAPRYLGMDRNRFNAEVRPHLTEIPIGKQGIGFDRLELDAWVDDYKSRNGRPAIGKETSHGTQTSTRPHHAGRDLAYRQAHLRAESLPEHWHSSARRSGTAPRESDGRDPTSPGLRRQAVSNLRAGRGKVRAGEPAQAEPRRRRQPAQGAHAVDRQVCPGQASPGHAAALDCRAATLGRLGWGPSTMVCRSSGAS